VFSILFLVIITRKKMRCACNKPKYFDSEDNVISISHVSYHGL